MMAGIPHGCLLGLARWCAPLSFAIEYSTSYDRVHMNGPARVLRPDVQHKTQGLYLAPGAIRPVVSSKMLCVAIRDDAAGRLDSVAERQRNKLVG